ncbi:MAG TPA: DUF6531 domain-containing protein [Verrucomicrobiae bacterium]|nr:DUF6531 domain-containing protein [Verrucomicrobiae bacterium]
MTVISGSSNLTGINPWWTYEEAALPGVGTYLVNVANGNLIVQADDVDVPERGIDLAFRRTYNSFSKNDWNASGGNDDGSAQPSTYGAGWTNTFDAHLATNTAGGISVFDIDGARYDYTPNGSCLNPPAGMHNTLCSDGGSGYFWTKKTGTVYYFYAPNQTASSAGYDGRLLRIYARNQNNDIQFNYSWVGGNSSTTANLTQIVAQHSDGQSLTLAFGTINGKVLLSSITRPDGSQVTYSYGNPSGNNAYGNLEEVDRPGNNQGTLKEQYGYYASNGILNWISSPRWFMSSGVQGAYTWFTYDGSSRISGVQLYGIANWTVADGTNTLLQPGMASGAQTIAQNNFSYPSNETQLTDLDGHASNWFYDSIGRVTQTREWTRSLWLITYATWDSNNNLTETVDARGYATDYAYDSNGNTIAVALPSVLTSQGTFRPTSLYSYDRTNGANNIIQYCDPVKTNALGQDWTGNPGTSDNLCPNQSGATRYTWDYSDGAEPFGRLSNSYTPLGYHRAFSYSSGAQGGDYGLPSDVTGDSMTQADGTLRSPHQSFAYDGNGNLTSYSLGVGSWTLSYDSLNRLKSAADPTGVTSYKYYNADGSLSRSESAYQHATGTGSTFSYDADGDENQGNVSHGGAYNGGSPTLNAAATTTKYYDGADRLVEVVPPQDGSDIYTKPWITRYIYDLSQNGTFARPTYQGQTLLAYGNMAKTQEFLPANPVVQWSSGQITPTQFQDIKGQAFDALDRVTSKYQMTNTGTDVINKDTNTYDAGTNYGLLTSTCNALSACTTPSYNSIAQTTQVAFSDTTPARIYTFDPDGRTNVASNTYGSQTYTYDTDGRETQSAETLNSVNGATLTAPATLTYHYYADGTRSSVDVASTALSQATLFSYAYRVDGVLQWQQINDAANTNVGTTALSMTYDNAGRLTGRTESGTGANSTPIAVTYNTTYGFATQKSYPGGTLSAIGYDASGAPLGYAATPSGGGATPYTYQFSSRGELTSQSATGQSATRFANGAVVGVSAINTQPYKEWDAQMGVMLGTDSIPFGQGSTGIVTGSGSTFDAAGRMIDQATSGSDPNTSATWGNDAARQFDAENHVTHESYTGDPSETSVTSYGAATYAWGSNGHPIAIGSGYSANSTNPAVSYDTLHWDGNALLFTTNAQGQLDDIKVGDVGDITPSGGLIFYDRGFGNEVSFCHSKNGAGGTGADSYVVNGGRQGPQERNPCGLLTGAPATPLWAGPVVGAINGGVGHGGILTMPRSDGLSDGYNTIQGTRSYDSSVGNWTTPDAYSGDLDDPATQKSYMWDGNNPVSYSDPSGYAALFYDPDQGNGGGSMPSPWADQANFKSASTGNSSAPPDPNSDVKNGTYTQEQAAKAGANAYGDYIKKANSSGDPTEWGFLVSCKTSSQCSYGGLLQGSAEEVGITLADVNEAELKGKLVAFWHIHPSGGAENFAAHISEGFRIARKTRTALPFTIYTSAQGNLYSQTVNGMADLDESLGNTVDTICSGCVPQVR